VNIIGKRLTLRAIEEGDLALLHQWANDPVTQDGIGELHFPSSMDFHKVWFQNLKNDPLNQRFAIDVPRIGIIGISSLINIDWRNNHAGHGIMIGDPSARGKGLGVDAVMATMRYAFDELHLERLEGSIIEYNKESYKLYCSKVLGWKEEGRRKNYYYRKGRYWDQLITGITRQDYKQLIETTRYWGFDIDKNIKEEMA
jgi:RimJ/RimL family protein N-acetyltransferase